MMLQVVLPLLVALLAELLLMTCNERHSARCSNNAAACVCLCLRLAKAQQPTHLKLVYACHQFAQW
jgi:hypothetical protein